MEPLGLDKRPSGGSVVHRWIPLAILAAGFVAFFVFGLDEYFTFAALKRNRGELMTFVAANPVFAPVVFVAAYATVVAFSLPIAAIFSMMAGFLFGNILGTLSAALGASSGAIVIFLAARTAFGHVLAERAGPRLRKLEAGFRRNALSYLLFIRMVPIFPFWLVNLAAALLGMPLSTYALATFIGIFPVTFAYVNVGRGLGAVFDSSEEPSIASFLNGDVILAVSLLGALSLLPVLYRHFRGNNAAPSG
jgi:uncharacterized membrane protein YdjX (TVP38/TMEM64 family)